MQGSLTPVTLDRHFMPLAVAAAITDFITPPVISLVIALSGVMTLIAPQRLYHEKKNGKRVFWAFLFRPFPEKSWAIVGRVLGLVLVLQVLFFHRDLYELAHGIPPGTNYQDASESTRNSFMNKVKAGFDSRAKGQIETKIVGTNLHMMQPGKPETEFTSDLNLPAYWGLPADQVADHFIKNYCQQANFEIK